MGRVFGPITVEGLAAKIEAAQKDDYGYNFIQNDLKVSFDFENVSTSPASFGEGLNGLLGYNQLDNGMTFLGVYAGGDWEIPVFFIVYWDGKKLRGYVPTKGNRWNTTTKCAYGNDQEDDEKNLRRLYGYNCREFDDCPSPNKDEIIEDIKERILPQGSKPPKQPKEPEEDVKTILSRVIIDLQKIVNRL